MSSGGLLIASDGSGGHSVAGYATVVYNGSGNVTIYKGKVHPYEITGAILTGSGMEIIYNREKAQNATNNRGELCGLLCSVLVAKSRGANNFTLITDSKYCIGIFTEWLDNWIAKNILSKKLNTDIIMLIRSNMAGINMNFVHQKAHLTNAQLNRLSPNDRFFATLNMIADTKAEEGRTNPNDREISFEHIH